MAILGVIVGTPYETGFMLPTRKHQIRPVSCNDSFVHFIKQFISEKHEILQVFTVLRKSLLSVTEGGNVLHCLESEGLN